MSYPLPFDSVYHALVSTCIDPHAAIKRMDAFQRKDISSNDLTLMSQDLLDAQVLGLLTPDYLVAATHCLRQGLCVTRSGWLH